MTMECYRLQHQNVTVSSYFSLSSKVEQSNSNQVHRNISNVSFSLTVAESNSLLNFSQSVRILTRRRKYGSADHQKCSTYSEERRT